VSVSTPKSTQTRTIRTGSKEKKKSCCWDAEPLRGRRALEDLSDTTPAKRETIRQKTGGKKKLRFLSDKTKGQKGRKFSYGNLPRVQRNGEWVQTIHSGKYRENERGEKGGGSSVGLP